MEFCSFFKYFCSFLRIFFIYFQRHRLVSHFSSNILGNCAILLRILDIFSELPQYFRKFRLVLLIRSTLLSPINKMSSKNHQTKCSKLSLTVRDEEKAKKPNNTMSNNANLMEHVKNSSLFREKIPLRCFAHIDLLHY